jgi:hypothetical protein
MFLVLFLIDRLVSTVVQDIANRKRMERHKLHSVPPWRFWTSSILTLAATPTKDRGSLRLFEMWPSNVAYRVKESLLLYLPPQSWQGIPILSRASG